MARRSTAESTNLITRRTNVHGDYASLIECVSDGDHKSVYNILCRNQSLKLETGDMEFIIRKKFKRVMSTVVHLSEIINIDESVISGCIKNGWKDIVKDIMMRKEFNFIDFLNSNTIIWLLELDNLEKSKWLVSNHKLDLLGKNIEVLKYVLRKDKIELLKEIMKTVKIDFESNNYEIIAFIMVSDSCNISRFLMSPESGMKKTEKMQKFVFGYWAVGQGTKASYEFMK
jgi:hypothetical protein